MYVCVRERERGREEKRKKTEGNKEIKEGRKRKEERKKKEEEGKRKKEKTEAQGFPVFTEAGRCPSSWVLKSHGA